MSIFSKPKVEKPVPAANAPTAAVDDQVGEVNQGVSSLISSGSAAGVSPKRKASTSKPSLIGGV